VKVLLVGAFAAAGQPLLERFLANPCNLVALGEPFDETSVISEIGSADIVIGKPFTRLMGEQAKNLRLIQSTGAGLDRYHLADLPPGVRLCVSYHHEAAMAEYVILVMLALSRRLLHFDAQLRKGLWDGSCIFSPLLVSQGISGKTVGLIGYGRIGKEVAQRATALGMRVQAIRGSTPLHTVPGLDFMGGPTDLPRLLATSDYVVITCPLTPATEGLIGSNELRLMQRDSYLVNVSRGRIVQEQAIYEALKSGSIAGAAIDVWYRYPEGQQGSSCSPSNYPFGELANVIMTPHVSCCTREVTEERWRDIAFNIDHLDSIEPLRNEIV
jgi:phosphoglycerate dehydrogenase-like enzyme